MTPDTNQIRDKRDSQRPYRDFGSIVKSARMNQGWSRPKVSKDAGISYSVLANVESGRRRASENILERLARTLGLELDRLRSIRDQSERGVVPAPGTGIQAYLRGERDEPPAGFQPAMPGFDPAMPGFDPAAGSGAMLTAFERFLLQSIDDIPGDAPRIVAIRQLNASLDDLDAEDVQRVADFAEALQLTRKPRL